MIRHMHELETITYSGFAGDVIGHVVFILEAMVEDTPLQNVLPSSADIPTCLYQHNRPQI